MSCGLAPTRQISKRNLHHLFFQPLCGRTILTTTLTEYSATGAGHRQFVQHNRPECGLIAGAAAVGRAVAVAVAVRAAVAVPMV